MLALASVNRHTPHQHLVVEINFSLLNQRFIHLLKKIMLNFNNPCLTAQAKRDMLHLEVSAEYREEKRRMEKAGMRYSSPSYWLLSIAEFLELAKASKSLDTLFSGEMKENLCHPSFQVLLMEYDRVEAGEWDNFHQRFTPVGYQNVCIVGINGFLKGEVPKSPEELEREDFNGGIYCPEWEQYKEELKDYPETAYWSEQGEGFFPIGIWDIPINDLSKYEDKRLWKRTYYFSEYYEYLMEAEIKKLKQHLLKRAKKNVKASSKGFSRKSKNNKGGKKGKQK